MWQKLVTEIGITRSYSFMVYLVYRQPHDSTTSYNHKFKIFVRKLILFSFWVFFYKHSRFARLQGNGGTISLTFLYHFYPLHRHWNKCRAIDLKYYSDTAQKMKFSVKDFFSKCGQICRFLRIKKGVDGEILARKRWKAATATKCVL